MTIFNDGFQINVFKCLKILNVLKYGVYVESDTLKKIVTKHEERGYDPHLIERS